MEEVKLLSSLLETLHLIPACMKTNLNMKNTRTEKGKRERKEKNKFLEKKRRKEGEKSRYEFMPVHTRKRKTILISRGVQIQL